MVIYCVAFGCKNEQDRRRISFHGFPLKRPEILRLWIKAVRRKNWAPTKYSKICGEHFLPTDYVVKPGVTAKFLKPDAVPSVFLHHKYVSPKIAEPCRKVEKQELSVEVHNDDVIEDTISHGDIDAPSTSTSSPGRLLIHRGTQTVSNENELKLRRKIKTLKQKLKRRDVEISRMKEAIDLLCRS